MTVGFLEEISIVGIFDRGKPNLERIVLRANEDVNLGQYGLMIGIKGADGRGFPVRDNLLWFGDGILKTGDWLFIYTDAGKPTISQIPNGTERLISIHWGRPETVLHDPNLTAILFRIDAVQVLQESPTLPTLT